MEKHFLLGLVLLAFKLSVKCVVINPAVAYHLEYDLADNVDWVRIPTMVGEWIWTHRRSVNAMMKQHRSDEPPVKVEFLLHTRRDTVDEGHSMEVGNIESLLGSNFRSDLPTRIIVHGWQSSKSSPLAESIRDTYLLLWDYNVIVVDWSDCALDWNYVRAVGCVPVVGQTLARLLDEFQQHAGLMMENVYVVGHSLGAHVAGIAGKRVQNGRLHTIIGLDPALPLFSIHEKENRIDHQDAMYVEVIHTDGGLLGFRDPIGTADFYPNGGSHQPGCGLDVVGLCSHTRAWELFAESLLEPVENLVASRIESLEEIERLPPVEMDSIGLGDYVVERVKMGGEPSNAGHAQGLYSITTSDKSPFFRKNRIA
ncbi:phospholipase A1-like [Anopheles merus]|nr:phospholipase A1-like [Anopheles merus]